MPLHPPLSQRELDLKLGPRLSDRIMLAGNRTPDAVAVVDTGFSPPKSFTYRALAQRSWRVAEQLRSIVSGKPKPRVVAVVMHKGWEQVVGAVGVLRTHSVYLPIDASTPELRTTQILEASGAVAVVATRDVIIKSLKNCNVPIVIVSDDLSGEPARIALVPLAWVMALNLGTLILRISSTRQDQRENRRVCAAIIAAPSTQMCTLMSVFR